MIASPDVIVRVARVDERVALEALQWRASLANPADRDALIAHPDAIDLPETQIMDGLVFVAERSGAVEAFAALLDRADGEMELDGLFVEPLLWRSGLGRILVEHCAEASLRRGAHRLHVVANAAAEGFYQACNFVLAGREATRFGPASRMVRSLHAPVG